MHTKFEVAYVPPLAYGDYLNAKNCGSWISVPLKEGKGCLNSIQNEYQSMYGYFDLCFYNPRCEFFQAAKMSIADYSNQDECEVVGLTVTNILRPHHDQSFIGTHTTPSIRCRGDSVLTNMRTQVSLFRRSTSLATGSIGTITDGPKARERKRFELFNLLVDHEYECEVGRALPFCVYGCGISYRVRSLYRWRYRTTAHRCDRAW
jgi:hypothetical protein